MARPGPEVRCSLRAAGGSPRLMGIVNVTPDSFSDGGRYTGPESAVNHAMSLVASGADIVDVGGESTRPGADPVDSALEQSRVLPVIAGIRDQSEVLISIDTRRADTARAALAAGAGMVNDVSALTDPDMAGVVAQSGAKLVLMHMRGMPADMQDAPSYGNVVAEVREFLWQRTEQALGAGIASDCLVVDPGIGFGKQLEHNLAILAGLVELQQLGYPVMLGASRKSFIGSLTGLAVEERVYADVAVAALAVRDGVDILRVHDIAAAKVAVQIAAAICGAAEGNSK